MGNIEHCETCEQPLNSQLTAEEAGILWRVASGLRGAPQGTMWPKLIDKLRSIESGGQ